MRRMVYTTQAYTFVVLWERVAIIKYTHKKNVCMYRHNNLIFCSSELCDCIRVRFEGEGTSEVCRLVGV